MIIKDKLNIKLIFNLVLILNIFNIDILQAMPVDEEPLGKDIKTEPSCKILNLDEDNIEDNIIEFFEKLTLKSEKLKQEKENIQKERDALQKLIVKLNEMQKNRIEDARVVGQKSERTYGNENIGTKKPKIMPY